VLEPAGVGGLEYEERGEEGNRAPAEHRSAAEGEDDQHPGEHERRPCGKLAARDRPEPLDRMLPVVRSVAHVVGEVRGARRGAVDGEGEAGLQPAGDVAELRGEDQPGEEQQVLRPLPRTERRERCPRA
jgi:hypothetical protein